MTDKTSFSNVSHKAFFNQFEQSLYSSVSFQHKRVKAQKDDIFMKYPIRALGYCNEVGEALRPVIKGVATAMWLPTIGYVAMDIKDKFERGEKKDYTKPSLRSGIEEALFQFLASITLPTGAVKIGQYFSEKLVTKKPQIFDKVIHYVDNKQLLKNIVNKMADSKNSGYRNVGLAMAGMTTLLLMAKPIDLCVEKLISIIFHKTNRK